MEYLFYRKRAKNADFRCIFWATTTYATTAINILRCRKNYALTGAWFFINFWKNWKKSPWSPFMFFSKIFEKNWRGDQGKFFFKSRPENPGNRSRPGSRKSRHSPSRKIPSRPRGQSRTRDRTLIWIYQIWVLVDNVSLIDFYESHYFF